MKGPPGWAYKALGILTGVTLLLLVTQYLLGLWTAAYAPATFTSDTTFPSLDWHYNIGFILGLLSIAVIIVAALSRQVRLIVPAVVLFVAVLLAGMFGSRFVGTTPNDPRFAFAMGVMFLVAFGAAMGLAGQLARRRWPSSGPTSPAGAPVPSS
ncbi:MAG: hypothetical protein L3K19_01275 [Thermoplasmata archaeon]|nr:hypothetical protein [Thermoplasmata archaeon]